MICSLKLLSTKQNSTNSKQTSENNNKHPNNTKNKKNNQTLELKQQLAVVLKITFRQLKHQPYFESY